MARQLVIFMSLALVLSISLPASGTEEFEMVFPHDGLTTEFSNDFGVYARERTHKGNDIFSPKGTPVVAVADGFVVQMRRGTKPGYYLEVRHADGYSTLYIHLNDDEPDTDNGRGGWAMAFAEGLESGDFVQAGQVIGYVGDSGNAENTPSHTHFELHRWGRPINPYPFLADANDAYQVRQAIEAGETVYR